MPYDVVRLKQALGLSSAVFLARYADVRTGPATGLPVASLRFCGTAERTCPFVSPAGCGVYDHRPASCRLYPLARVVQRSRSDGTLSVNYALIREAHCRGFEESRHQSVDQWIADQGLGMYLEMNDGLMEFIALKNRLRAGPLAPELQQSVRLALYDVEQLRSRAMAGNLEGAREPQVMPLPHTEDDIQWLKWGQRWIRMMLFGHPGETLVQDG
jgi:Fe-S-cluster containining protein